MDKQQILRQYFGYRSFREGQEPVIDALISGRDALAVMPTGGGKSLCYQVPALAREGVTLVISPLISLMRDQVLALKSVGVPAAYINSSLTPDQIALVCRRARQGAYKVIYLAPERLETPSFLALVQTMPLALVAVDEAHCVSQWGPDFRPSYLRIADFLAALPQRPPVGAFTATATAAVRRDIVQLLGLKNPLVQLTGFDRPNLFFDVIQAYATQKPIFLQQLLQQRPDKSGIVYCATRSAVEQVHSTLIQQGFQAGRYHAGLEEEERRRTQEDFQYDRIRIMVATNAFGMGIDKSNVRFVIHYNMPLSLEAYYQEAGRAGRDGARADCILLFCPSDIRTAKFLIENGGENDDLTPQQQQHRLTQDLRRLNAMEVYCKTGDCLRREILRYFGEKLQEDCGNCGSCLRRHRRRDITREAQILLSTAVRAKKALGHAASAETLADIVYGGSVEAPLNGLSTYGLMADCSMAQLMEWLDVLLRKNYLMVEEGGLMPGDWGRKVLFQGERVWIDVYLPGERRLPQHQIEELAGEQLELYNKLEQARSKLARKYSVPDYTICTDATLIALVLHRPQSPEELAAIDGMGDHRANRYARTFLPLLTANDT